MALDVDWFFQLEALVEEMSPADTEWTAESVSAVSSMQSIAPWCTPTAPACDQVELREGASGGRSGGGDSTETTCIFDALPLHCKLRALTFQSVDGVISYPVFTVVPTF